MNMKQKKIKIEPRIKLNYNIDVNLDIRKVSLYGLKWFCFVFVLFFLSAVLHALYVGCKVLALCTNWSTPVTTFGVDKDCKQIPSYDQTTFK